MFSFANSWDIVLITIGTLGAIITGGVMPFFSVLMGEIVDGFNGDSADFKDKIGTLCLILVFGGCVNFVTGFFQVSNFLQSFHLFSLHIDHKGLLLEQDWRKTNTKDTRCIC